MIPFNRLINVRIPFKFLLLCKLPFCFLLIPFFSNAQSCLGIGFGSENIHIGSGPQLRSLVPHITYQYVPGNMRQAYFFEIAGFQRNTSTSTVITNSQGNDVPAEERYQYRYIVMHAGAKAYLNGDVDERKLTLIVGGGLCDVLSFGKYTVKSTDGNVRNYEQRHRKNAIGLDFLGGLHYYAKPFLLELKCNIDLLPKGISEYTGFSNIHTNTRFTIVFPLNLKGYNK